MCSSTPFHHLPTLEFYTDSDQKVTLSESHSITRTVASQYGFSGKNSVDEAKADMIYEVMVDIRNYIATKIKLEPDPDKKAEMIKVFRDEWFPRYGSNLEKQLKANNNGADGPYFVGKDLTYADLAAYNIFSMLLEEFWPGHLVANFPALAAHTKRIGELERIKAYVAGRPQTAN